MVFATRQYSLILYVIKWLTTFVVTSLSMIQVMGLDPHCDVYSHWFQLTKYNVDSYCLKKEKRYKKRLNALWKGQRLPKCRV